MVGVPGERSKNCNALPPLALLQPLHSHSMQKLQLHVHPMLEWHWRHHCCLRMQVLVVFFVFLWRIPPRKWTNVTWKGTISKGNWSSKPTFFRGHSLFLGVFKISKRKTLGAPICRVFQTLRGWFTFIPPYDWYFWNPLPKTVDDHPSLPSLKLTFSPLKMDGWKPSFRGDCC